MTSSIKNGGYAFLIRLDLMFSLSLWKEIQLLQVLNDLSIRHLIKLIIYEKDEYLNIAYADHTTFFLKDISSNKFALKDLNLFSGFSRLRPNFTKSEIAGIGVLKRVNVALCGMKCLDLSTKWIKVLRVHISLTASGR